VKSRDLLRNGGVPVSSFFRDTFSVFSETGYVFFQPFKVGHLQHYIVTDQSLDQ